MEKLTRSNNERVNGRGLELFHSFQSFYSQKVVFTLQEKKLSYHSKIVDIYNFEQYEPWYLKINPIAEVPVLKDDVKVIPDSVRIIDYLEDNFSNGDKPRLTPEKGTEQWLKMKMFREILDSAPIKLLTIGTLWHPELTIKSKINEVERKQRLALFDNLPMKLDELIVSQPEFSQFLLQKKTDLLHSAGMKNGDKFKELLKNLETDLDSVESELASHDETQSEWWLCGEDFTLADISLTMLLGRLNFLGLLEHIEQAKPNLKQYFKRAQLRDSYQNAISQGRVIKIEKKVQRNYALSYAIGSFLLLGLIVTATFLYKRLK